MRMIVCGRGLGLKAQNYPANPFGCGDEELSCAADSTDWVRMSADPYPIREILEIQLKPKLELPWVERGGWAAEVAAIAGALIEQPHVVDERRRRSLVEAIE
jgi:hypothetical protein